MGSCISKCKPKNKSKPKPDLFQDKLVLSSVQTLYSPVAVSPLPVEVQKPQSPSPSPSPISTTSFSSFSGATSNSSSASSLSSSSSSASSGFALSPKARLLSPKDRSFSNEFLWSCVKENPHIIGVIPTHAKKPDSPAKQQFPVPERAAGALPKKRVRANSPALTRQKSFRQEPDRPNSLNSIPGRNFRQVSQLRSPSPSRRFTGDLKCGVSENTAKGGNSRRTSSAGAKENLRPASPINSSNRIQSQPKKKEKQIGSKIDEIAVPDRLSDMETDPDLMEDIDNPLIALDCFIFL